MQDAGRVVKEKEETPYSVIVEVYQGDEEGSVQLDGADEPERSLAQHQPPVASRQNPNDTHISPSRAFLPARVMVHFLYEQGPHRP